MVRGPRGGEGIGPGGASRAVEDYLKAVYKLLRDRPAVSTNALAEELGRSAASVTNMVKSLAEQGLVEHTPYHGVRLTASGELTALRIIRRHRVIELFLIEKLGYSWEAVHQEAERLEHAASDALIDRMARALGEPSEDPHGSPIPTREGVIEVTESVVLVGLEPGLSGVVREVSDDSAEGLRRLASLGLFPGTRIRVLERADDGAGMSVEVNGERQVVEDGLAAAVFVEVDEESG